MDALLKQRISESIWEQQDLAAIAALLPEEDASLLAVLEEAIESTNTMLFIYTLMAALGNGRQVPARIIARSAHLVPNMSLLGVVICHLQLDATLPEHLVEASKLPLVQECRALCLMLAAKTCVDHREGVFPPDLLAQARTQARSDGLREETRAFLNVIRSLTQDAGLTALMLTNPRKGPDWEKEVKLLDDASLALLDQYLKIWRAPPLSAVPQKQQQWGPGTKVRRSVPKIGRNDPCHCGSGQKYKRCCQDKDQHRLRLSSHVAGKTIAEVNEEPEPHVTIESLQNTHACELVRYDIRKLNPKVLPTYLFYLGAFGIMDKVVSDFEVIGCEDEQLEAVWWQSHFYLIKCWRADLVPRLLNVRKDVPDLMQKLRPSVRLLLASPDPAAFLDQLQKEITALLHKDIPDDNFFGIAHALLNSPYSALGILVARSIIPFMSKTSAVSLEKELLIVRDRLFLSPNDPISDLLYRRYSEEVHDHGEDAAALREARSRLEAKNAEGRRLQAEIAHLRHELEHQEELSKAPPNAAQSQPPPDPQVVKDLRLKVESLKGLLDEQHQQRALLNQDLQKAYAELHATRKSQPTPTPAPVDETDENTLTLPSDFGDEDQPVRLVEFPRKFRETLHHFPTAVARSVMTLLGRLAAGDASAFKGVLRLKSAPDYLRARVGRDHRLIFHLKQEAIQVADFINRRDLEKRIKSLRNELTKNSE